METIKITHYPTPAGDMILGSFGDRICVCDWATGKRRDIIERRIQRHLGAVYEESSTEVTGRAIYELDEYFDGKRKSFTIPVLFTGTAFQCQVWSELTKIPYGSTISYAELARRINNPKAIRAVAGANAMNPISIFVPCHRVIGSNDRLTGYAGGLDAKRYLIDMEGRNCGSLLDF